MLAQNPREIEEAVKVDFEERLRFYLDEQSKAFLQEMVVKERMLLQLIQNISAEIKSRGAKTILEDQPGFGRLYGDIEGMVKSYNEEIERIKTLIAEITELEDLMVREQRYGMADLFAALKDSLEAVIDNRDLYKKLPVTYGYVSSLLKEYDFELDYFKQFYNRLTQMEKAARRLNDYDLLDRIGRQKRRILEIIALGDSTQSDSLKQKLADEYFSEVQKTIRVLKELESIQKKASQSDPETLTEVEILRRELLSKMDRRLLKMFGYDDYLPLQGPTVSQMFDEWRKARLSQWEAKFTEYKVMKVFLIKNGDSRERSRMLERDLNDALLNYADGQFRLAELQFDQIIEDYRRYFPKMEAVYFYRAEAQYAQLFYEQAYDGYKELLADYPNTRFRDEVYLRMLTIAQTLSRKNDFYQLFERFKTFAEQVHPKIRNRIYYLAGYYFLQNRDTRSAEEALTKIEKGSKYYFPGLYLTGLALANRGAYEGATRIFSLLVDSNLLPWSDPLLAELKNNALLKLGYIYYDRGEYEKALEYLNRISRGVEGRDKVLVGLAWAHMKNGEYEEAIRVVNELFGNYLGSNYTYEALVLAAHCKRLLNQPDDALKDLRYVANARGVLDIADRYNEERHRLLEQLDELEEMEKKVLDRQDRQLYEVISQIKFELQKQILNLGYAGGIGSTLIQEFDSERQAIYRQIQELEQIIAEARKAGRNDVLKTAMAQRQRLIKALTTYQADRQIDHVNYFIDYPLATRESSSKYRKRVLQEMLRDMELEKARIEKAMQKARELVKKHPEQATQIDLVALQEDLEYLQDRMDRFQTWLSEHEVEEISTDFDHWADFSGFGLSDITMQEIQKRDEKISQYTQNMMFIEELMRRRRKVLEERLARFDAEMEKIREELEAEQLRLRKLEHEKIFEKLYFDTTTTELPVEQRSSKGSSEIL
ncbi:MAG: hypothetical protein Q9P90_10050 [candidate division KSB1 bacterium]|nr:hypothetical protein [candidate division KSB1 bacterium]